MQLTAVFIPVQEDGFVAINPETGGSIQGESVEEARAKVQEATELYLEQFSTACYGQALLTTFEVSTRAA
jgi:predicted RNase H-like HicB family nuclease